MGIPQPQIRELIMSLIKEAVSSGTMIVCILKKGIVYITMDRGIERAAEAWERTGEMERFLRNS